MREQEMVWLTVTRIYLVPMVVIHCDGHIPYLCYFFPTADDEKVLIQGVIFELVLKIKQCFTRW